MHLQLKRKPTHNISHCIQKEKNVSEAETTSLFHISSPTSTHTHVHSSHTRTQPKNQKLSTDRTHTHTHTTRDPHENQRKYRGKIRERKREREHETIQHQRIIHTHTPPASKRICIECSVAKFADPLFLSLARSVPPARSCGITV